MNVIVIMCDTLRRDHVGAYGATEVHTPNLDRLAAESVVLDQAYTCSFPTVPCRAEIFTGTLAFPRLEWGPLPEKEPTLAEAFAGSRYTCTLVTDNLQLCKPGYRYERGFHSLIRIRGQDYDPFAPANIPVTLPCDPEKTKDARRLEQYLRNVSYRQCEEDWFGPQVMSASMEWLERHHLRGNFFLWIDCFDPHEPWDPPQEYVDRYYPGYTGQRVIHPKYGSASALTEDELRYVRALYRGEVTMVDAWVGKLLDCVDRLGLRDNTTVVMLSDHGIYLGDRGLIGKMGNRAPGERKGPLGWAPHEELSAIPMMWRVPGLPPGRRTAFAHPGDLSPTLLELSGVPVPSQFRARSLVPVLRGTADQVHDVAVSSWSLRGLSVRRPSVVRSKEWSMVFWRADIEPELYHRPSDPLERRNVYRENRGAARELHGQYLRFLREQDVPLRNLLPRYWTFPMARPARVDVPGLVES